jgi:hypothetical protein
MSSAPVPQRMNRLEEALAELALAQVRTQGELDQLSREMREFKNEMRTFKDEMGAFKDEMSAFKDDMRRSSMNADRRLGDLANKLGRLVEDILGPSVPAAFEAIFGVSPQVSAIRHRRQHPQDAGRVQEFDAFAAGGEVFLLVEAQSTLRATDIEPFLELLRDVRQFFPEHTPGRRVLGALAAFHADPSLVTATERRGVFVFGLDRNLIEVLNSPGFQPQAF